MQVSEPCFFFKHVAVVAALCRPSAIQCHTRYPLLKIKKLVYRVLGKGTQGPEGMYLSFKKKEEIMPMKGLVPS